METVGPTSTVTDVVCLFKERITMEILASHPEMPSGTTIKTFGRQEVVVNAVVSIMIMGV